MEMSTRASLDFWAVNYFHVAQEIKKKKKTYFCFNHSYFTIGANRPIGGGGFGAGKQAKRYLTIVMLNILYYIPTNNWICY